jgi:hypothetical protein
MAKMSRPSQLNSVFGRQWIATLRACRRRSEGRELPAFPFGLESLREAWRVACNNGRSAAGAAPPTRRALLSGEGGAGAARVSSAPLDGSSQGSWGVN